jgi:GNAT superfamily N-acetyltransferase
MSDYIIKQGGIDDLDRVRPLWEKLNQLHYSVSPYFRNRFLNNTWEDRKADLLQKCLKLFLEYAIDEDTQHLVGYCISTIDKEKVTVGEIDSIYIEEPYRKTGIGKVLVQGAVDWLVSEGTETQKLLVGVGNEQVLDYYRQFGFFPLHIVLQRKDKG